MVTILRPSSGEIARTLREFNMPERKQPRIRLIGYPRISDPSREDGSELISQEKQMRKYAAEHPEVDLVTVKPEAISGYLKPFRSRKVYSEIMDMIIKGLADGILVTKYGRLSRRQGEIAVMIELLAEYGAKAYSCTETFDNTPEGRFMISVASYLAERDRNDIVERTNRGMLDRVEAGNLSGRGLPLYGYDYADTEMYTHAYYIINEKEAEWRKWMFERAAEGWSDRRIARELTSRGVPTKTGKKAWHYGTVAALLKDPHCAGIQVSAMRYVMGEKGHSVKQAQAGKVSLPSHVIPAIVSVELYEEVQRQRTLNKELSFRNNKHPKVQVMRGLLRCGICGHKLHVNNRVKKGVWKSSDYFCFWQRGGDELIHNHSLSISTRQVDDEAWALAVAHARNTQLIRDGIDALRKENEQQVDLAKVKGMLEEVKSKYRRLYDLAGETEDEDMYEEIKIRLGALEIEKKGLEAMAKEVKYENEEAGKVEEALQQLEEKVRKILPLLDDENYVPDFDDKLTLIKALGIRGIVNPVGEKEKKRLELTVSPPSVVDVLEAVGIMRVASSKLCHRL